MDVPMSPVFIHPTAEVSPQAIIGDGTRIWHHAQVREGAVIGKECILGKDVYIDKHVQIGNNVKIQNRATLYDGVTVEDDVFIGPHAVFTNDMFPRSISPGWKVTPTLVKKGASIGANATILCGIVIGSYVMIGAGSVVTKDVPAHTLMYGNPATAQGFVCSCGRKAEKKKEGSEGILLFCQACKKDTLVKS
jgi:acetyltransferase-like isoleucine patch superfamily enzyme